MKVLLVEDDVDLADVVARNLGARGHVVRTEATAEGALTSMMEDWPDAAIVDINLPDASGWEILRGLSPRDREELHVVVISGAPLSQIRITEFRPAHALVKPFPIKALVEAVEDTDRTPTSRAGDSAEAGVRQPNAQGGPMMTIQDSQRGLHRDLQSWAALGRGSRPRTAPSWLHQSALVERMK